MTKIIKVSDDFHAFLKAKAEQERRTMVAQLDYIMEEVMGLGELYTDIGKAVQNPDYCPQHNMKEEFCKLMKHEGGQS